MDNPSVVAPDSELLTAEQAYKYINEAEVLVQVWPSFQVEDDTIFAKSASKAERDFNELFRETFLPVREPILADWTDICVGLDQASEDDLSEHNNLQNGGFVGRVEYPHAPIPPPLVPSPPAQQPERSIRPDVRRSRLEWDVPLIVSKKTEIHACPDTGSGQNILSKETAVELGVLGNLDRGGSSKFILGNGNTVRSLGVIDLEICFTQEPKLMFKCPFHVFERLICPVIIGAAFLRQTETLTKHRQRRLRQIPRQPSAAMQVIHVGTATERFKCYVDNALVVVHADTGSEMDLVSKQFVRKSAQRARALQEPLPVEFADGSTSWVSHQIFTKFSSDLEQPKSNWKPKWFYVLDDLPCEILLGRETLEDVDAFNPGTSSAVEVITQEGIQLHTIFWAGPTEQKMGEAFKFGPSSRSLKRKNDADGEMMHHQYHRSNLMF